MPQQGWGIATGFFWVEVRDVAKHFIMHSTVPPPPKNDLPPNVNNAEGEKPCFRFYEHFNDILIIVTEEI